MSKLTDWYPADIKPMREGLYMTDATGDGRPSFQYWTGKHWGLQGYEESFWPFMPRNYMKESYYQYVRWRGHASKP